MSTPKIHPPFSKPLSILIKQNLKPNNSVYLFVGHNAWARGHVSAERRPTRTLILPGYVDSNIYTWPVTACDILIIDTSFCDQSYIEELAFCLFQYKAEAVRFISSDYQLTIYKKDL